MISKKKLIRAVTVSQSLGFIEATLPYLKQKYDVRLLSSSGKELDEIYSLCNVAIAHLALHRIGLNQLSSLKSCEYASRGLPMISSASLNIANDETRKYIMYVPEDETPINIDCLKDIFS